jgi:hypothetical protein
MLEPRATKMRTAEADENVEGVGGMVGSRLGPASASAGAVSEEALDRCTVIEGTANGSADGLRMTSCSCTGKASDTSRCSARE